MPETIRVGVLGLVHDHVWGNLSQLVHVEGVQLVGAADPNPPLLQKFREQTECGATYDSYEQLLDEKRPQAVLAYGTNRGTGELVEMAAERGMHVMIEKPMASDLDVADRMLVAARRAGVVLMVNWPTAWSPSIRHALALVQGGAIGRVWQFKHRGGHCGPQELGCSEEFCGWLFDPIENGGGALFDYLGYGASLARLLIGRPMAVTAIAGRLVKDYIPVDDNGIVLLEYRDANAVIECTWTEPVPGRPPHDPVVYGTEGVLVAGRDAVTVYSRKNPGGEAFQPPPLAAPERNGPEYFIHCIVSGEPVRGMCSAENSLDTQEIMEAARMSVISGRKIGLPIVEHLFGT